MAPVCDSHYISVGQRCSKVCEMRKNQQRRLLGRYYKLTTERFHKGRVPVLSCLFFPFISLASNTSTWHIIDNQFAD